MFFGISITKKGRAFYAPRFFSQAEKTTPLEKGGGATNTAEGDLLELLVV